MIEVLLFAVSAGAALGAGIAAGRWAWPRTVTIHTTETEDGHLLNAPPPCDSKGHNPHIKGTVVVKGVKHKQLYCAREWCPAEWLEVI